MTISKPFLLSRESDYDKITMYIIMRVRLSSVSQAYGKKYSIFCGVASITEKLVNIHVVCIFCFVTSRYLAGCYQAYSHLL